MKLSITMTEQEILALSYSHTNFDFYLSSIAQSQVNLAVDDIVQITVTKCLETGTPIPGTKDEIVALAFAQGWVKTAAQRNAEASETPA